MWFKVARISFHFSKHFFTENNFFNNIVDRKEEKQKDREGESGSEWSHGDSCSSFTLEAKLAAMENWITASF